MSTTGGELVMNLRPPLSITLEGCGGDSSFIRHQQEVYELVHIHDQGEHTVRGHVHHGNTDHRNAHKNAPYHEGQEHDGYIHADHGPAKQHYGHAQTHHGPAATQHNVHEHAVYHLGQANGNEHAHRHHHHEHEHVHQHGEAEHALDQGHNVYGHVYVHQCIEGEIDEHGRLGHAPLQGHAYDLHHGNQVPNEYGHEQVDHESGHDHVHGHYEHEHEPSIHTIAPDNMSTEELDSIDSPTMLDVLPKHLRKLKPPSPPELMSMPELPPLEPKCRRKLKRPGHAMEDEELQPNVEATVSKNLACDKRKRNKLNERLFSLRARVPKISKDLQKQVNNMQYDILSPRTDTLDELVEQYTCVEEASSDCARRGTDSENLGHSFPIHRILELNVSKLEENLYHLKVHCKKGPGVLVQLTRALEALNFNFTHANIASVGDHILNTIVFKVLSSDELLKPRELEERIVDIVHMFGLQL